MFKGKLATSRCVTRVKCIGLLFFQARATCHRIGQEGHEVGPDLPGQIGLGEEALLKDVTGVRRLATSLMPSFAEGLALADVANVLAWLRSQIAAPTAPPARGISK